MAGKKSEVKKLTPKQRIFLNTYLTHPEYRFNAKESFIHAGFSKKCARQNAHILLNTNKYISEAVDKHLKSSDSMARDILTELHKIAMVDAKDIYDIDPDTGSTQVKPLNEIPDGLTSVISEIIGDEKISESADGSRSILHRSYKYKLHSKMDALKELVKIHGLAQPDKLDITSGGEKITAIDVNVKGVKIED